VYVQAIVVLAVIAGQVAVPPEFKASEDVPVEVTDSEKFTDMETVSPAFFAPLDVVVTEETVGAVVSAIETEVPVSETERGAASVFVNESGLPSVVGVNVPLAPPMPVALNDSVASVKVPVAPFRLVYPMGITPVAPTLSSGI